MQGALGVGALGYVLESDAAELPVALKAVMKGGKFISSSLGTQD